MKRSRTYCAEASSWDQFIAEFGEIKSPTVIKPGVPLEQEIFELTGIQCVTEDVGWGDQMEVDDAF